MNQLLYFGGIRMKLFIPIAGIGILALGLVGCASGTTKTGALSNLPPRPDNPPGHIGEVPSLGYIWAPYFPLGNIVSSMTFTWQSGHTADIGNEMREGLLKRHFLILTAENEMKPDWLRPADQPNTVTLNAAGANKIMNFAKTAGMKVHGHALAWHSQSPWWLNLQSPPPSGWSPTDSVPAPLPRGEAVANLVTHIETVMRHPNFRDMDSWEVLNEVFPDGVSDGVTADNWRTGLRNSPWLRAIGSASHLTQDPNEYCYIWIAFITARRVAYEIGRPDMVLYYNDYNEENPNKRDAIYYMVREMNETFSRLYPNGMYGSTRLIDAIGMQAHYHLETSAAGGAYPWGPVDPENVRASIERFASLGVGVSITELDVTVGNTAAGPITAEQERRQAIMYARLFGIFRDNAKDIRRITFWGINDGASWRSKGSPLLWDDDLRPKEAFWAVAAPDAFILPNGQLRSNEQIDAFLANPRASAFIPANAWD